MLVSRVAEIAAGISDLEQRSHRRKVRAFGTTGSHFGLRLAEAYVRLGQHARAEILPSGFWQVTEPVDIGITRA